MTILGGCSLFLASLAGSGKPRLYTFLGISKKGCDFHRGPCFFVMVISVLVRRGLRHRRRDDHHVLRGHHLRRRGDDHHRLHRRREDDRCGLRHHRRDQIRGWGDGPLAAERRD